MRKLAFFAYLALAFGVLFFAGCGNPVQPFRSGTGDVHLTLGSGFTPATIMPETTGITFESFELRFTPAANCTAGNTALETIHWTDASGRLELPSGLWNLHVTAILPNDEGYFTGSLFGINVTPGGTASGNVVLVPAGEGQGNFRWNIQFEYDLQVRLAYMVISQVAGNDFFYFATIILYGTDEGIGGRPMNLADTLPMATGQYRVVLTVYNTAGVRSVVSTALHIFPDMESFFEQDFTEDHFSVSLEDVVLGAWTGSRWNFADLGITYRHFYLLGVWGVYQNNFSDITYSFNTSLLTAAVPAQASLADLKALTDAAIISMGSQNANFNNRAEAIYFIEGLARNDTTVQQNWAADGRRVTVLVPVGTTELPIYFDIPLSTVPPTAGLTLAAQLAWLRDNAGNDDHYSIVLTGNENITTAQAALPAGRSGLSITISGGGETMRTVTLSGTGVMFIVGNGVTLVLDEYITLQGVTGNTTHLVRVTSGGTFVMGEGSVLSGNQNTTATSIGGLEGGGVRVNTGGVFVLDGGTVSGNSTTNTTTIGNGGGVRVEGGRFNMLDGTISGNAAQNGGGVFVSSTGTFHMSGGVVYGNEVTVPMATRNTVRGTGTGASLNSAGTAAVGNFLHGEFYPLVTLATTNNTLRVDDAGFELPRDNQGNVIVPGANLTERLAWLRANAVANERYLVEISAHEIIAPTTAATGAAQILPTGRNGLTITLRGTGGLNRIVNINANGSHFWVPSGVTLILDQNVILRGRGTFWGNTNHLVRVLQGGTFRMNAGSFVDSNQNTTAVAADGGAGVRVNFGGVFILDGGTIGGTTAATANSTTNTGAAGNGGGVRVDWGGNFDMFSGTIVGNTAQQGGGVFNEGTFRMSGGIIRGSNETSAANRNVSRAGNSAALQTGVISTTQLGTFDGTEFTPTRTIVSNTAVDVTMTVTNGTLAGPTGNLTQQLAWLRSLAQNNGNYTITLTLHQTITPTTAATGAGQILPTGRSNLTITIQGDHIRSNVSLSANGSHFWVPEGVTLVLGNNVTLQGRSLNNNHLVRVNWGGTFRMNTGSILSGNHNTTAVAADGGAGVRVNSGGVFILDGGTIGGTTTATANLTTNASAAGHGGGVRVEWGGRFDMISGTISSNNAQNGGGVWNDGTFRMGGGTILGSETTVAVASRNTARGTGAALYNANWPAERGTFNTAGTFTFMGYIATSNPTIQVVGGLLRAQGANAVDQFTWLRTHSQNNQDYLVELNANASMSPAQAALPTGTGLSVTLRGVGEMRTITLSANGNLFVVGNGVTLIADNNITLMGRGASAMPATAPNVNHLVRVNSGGTFRMNLNSVLTGNHNNITFAGSAADAGGGVRVNNGGVFILDGGQVRNNRASATGGNAAGAGVRVESGGRFDMWRGTIAGNDSNQHGGGVRVQSGGTFRIANGVIYGNEATVPAADRNVATSGGAAFSSDGTAQRGTVNAAGTFSNLVSLGAASVTTLRVTNGSLQ